MACQDNFGHVENWSPGGEEFLRIIGSSLDRPITFDAVHVVGSTNVLFFASLDGLTSRGFMILRRFPIIRQKIWWDHPHFSSKPRLSGNFVDSATLLYCATRLTVMFARGFLVAVDKITNQQAPTAGYGISDFSLTQFPHKF